MRGLTYQVAQREVGELPLSISTSIAFEALRDAPKLATTQMYVNIRTLFRNLLSSVDSDIKHRADIPDMVPVLLEEIKFINEFVPTLQHGQLEVVFYHCDYSDIQRKLPVAKHRVLDDATEKQKLYHFRENGTVQQLVKRASEYNINIQEFHTEIRSNRSSVVLFSHSPIDLLFNDFKSALLLESVTGAFKPKSLWNTKLTRGGNLPDLPFNKFTVQVFGDNNNYLYMQNGKIRNAVLEMAQKDNWNNTTNMSKIMSSISRLRDPLARVLLTKMARS